MLDKEPWLELWALTSQPELLISRDTALRGEADLIWPLPESEATFPLLPSGENVRIWGDDPRCSELCNVIGRYLNFDYFLPYIKFICTCLEIQLSKLPWDEILGVLLSLVVDLPGYDLAWWVSSRGDFGKSGFTECGATVAIGCTILCSLLTWNSWKSQKNNK